jgi:hypothetical protein
MTLWTWLCGSRAPGLEGASLVSRCARRHAAAAARGRAPRGRALAPPPGAAPPNPRARRPACAPRHAPRTTAPSPLPAPLHLTPPARPPRVTWSWVNPLINKGWTDTLEEGDAAFLVPPGDEVEPLAAEFDAKYQQVLQVGAAARGGGGGGG